MAYADAKLAAVNATNADLNAFRSRGGKIVMYSGWADPKRLIALYAHRFWLESSHARTITRCAVTARTSPATRFQGDY